LGASGVAEKGAESLCRVVIAGRVAIKRLKTKSGIVDPAGQTKERVCSLSRVGARIAAVGRRDNRPLPFGKAQDRPAGATAIGEGNRLVKTAREQDFVERERLLPFLKTFLFTVD
jgi:hypothetical protein